MRVNYVLVFLLVLVGFAVGLMSLYTASLSGVMGKLGLVGGDFGASIKTNELARQLRSQETDVRCDMWQVTHQIPRYLFSHGEERVRLSGELGGERIVCGIKHVQQGNVERGVYTIMKGLYYLKSHYSEMKLLVEQNADTCELLSSHAYEQWVEGYLNATEGRVHEVVLTVYKQVEASRSQVEELCQD